MVSDSPRQTPEATRFLQRRVAIFAAIGFAMGLAFLVQRLSQLVLIGGDEPVLQPSLAYHLIGVTAMALLFGLTWFGQRSALFVWTAELLLFSTSSVAYMAMAAQMPQVFRPNFTMLLVAIVPLLIRSIWVPSSWQRTGLLGVFLGIPLLAAVWHRYEVIDPSVLFAFRGQDDFFEVTPRNIRIDNLVVTAMWYTISAAIAACASGVIYGLRREVRKARTLGQYLLEEKLGEGGMGIVYRARHAMLRRPTAIKLLNAERLGEHGLARFELEVRAAARLSHPNTVTVFDYGRTPDGVFYYAMELLDGASLKEIVRVGGPLPPERVAHFLQQVASALAEAHGEGLIHRDIKPDNIVITRCGGIPDVAKVIDFGLVKEMALEGKSSGLTTETSIIGTPMYLAPEAIKSIVLADGRSDLYALGATAFFMLTGEEVFRASSAVEVCSCHLLTPPDRPSVRLSRELPEDLDSLVERCLAKDPDQRPASAEMLETEVRALSCFGKWSRAEAERWWTDNGPVLEERARAGHARANLTVPVDPRRT
jgi:serine/threonine-protein kinase